MLDDSSTSRERQFDKIQRFARLGDHELVPVTEADYDLDVSGAVSPFERPGLGPWLQEDRLNMWDAICVAKFDRLTRSLFDFVTLTSWLEFRGKTLVCLDPMLELAALAGEDVTGKQETLQRAQAKLARLHALTPVAAHVGPARTGQTFRQRWESLDAAGRNEFLRANNVRAVVSRDELPPTEYQAGPLTATDLPRTAIIGRPHLYAVIYLGSLGDMPGRPSSTTATVRPS